MNDQEFLKWIYDRLINVHGENKNYDYMHRLKAIIDQANQDVKLDRIVQTLNPRSNKYVKIDRVNGIIMSHKKTSGPYKNIQIISR